ncbi:MAG: short-chain dehydrogenase [Bacillota bacterium]
MKHNIFYLFALIFLSILIFITVGSSLGSINPTTDFLLSMIVSHLILDKNLWITKIFKDIYSQNNSRD